MATFPVRLGKQPSAAVSVSSPDTSEGSVSRTSLIFSMTNWNTNQTVTGADYSIDDGDRTGTSALIRRAGTMNTTCCPLWTSR